MLTVLLEHEEHRVADHRRCGRAMHPEVESTNDLYLQFQETHVANNLDLYLEL
jgi:hypothetical protein